MGETAVNIRIKGARGEKQLKALVDTGATHTTITEELAEELGIKAVDSDEVVLANGQKEMVGLGYAEIEIMGMKRTVPVWIYRSNLVGLTTLEIARLKVNPITRQPEKAPGMLLRVVQKGFWSSRCR